MEIAALRFLSAQRECEPWLLVNRASLSSTIDMCPGKYKVESNTTPCCHNLDILYCMRLEMFTSYDDAKSHTTREIASWDVLKYSRRLKVCTS